MPHKLWSFEFGPARLAPALAFIYVAAAVAMSVVTLGLLLTGNLKP